MCRRHAIAVACLVMTLGFAGRGLGQPNEGETPQPAQPTLPENWLESFNWRSVGPANTGGRITAIAVYEQDPSIWWAATASGGLLKTTNNGVTIEHQFDKEATVSIGDVQVAPSDPNIVWVGTGEANPRNSVSWGDGVYKSTDGGETWTNMGLKEGFQTGRILIHPTNPDIVYVGLLGRLWGPNEQRGLFKTTDGGQTWEKILYIDENTGVIDAVMSPADPDTLLVATYERRRDGFDGNDPAVKFGAGAGIYRTTDGGHSFARITAGLPTVDMGRIGLDVYRKDPNIVYAIIETEKIGQRPQDAAFAGFVGEDADVGARITSVTEGGPAEEAGIQVGDIIIAVDDEMIYSYEAFNNQVWKHRVDDTIKLTMSRDRESVEAELQFGRFPEAAADPRRGGRGGGDVAGAGGGRGGGGQARGGGRGRGGRGRRGNNPFAASLGGQSQNMQDRQGPDGHQYGGVYRSDDGGQSWTRINSLNPRPMYFSVIRVDPSDNNYLYSLGIQIHKSEDGGQTFSSNNTGRSHPDHHALWIDPNDGRHMILGNDGGIYVTWDRMSTWDHHNHVAIGQFYHVSVGPNRNYRVYGGLQDNSSWGGPARVRNGNGPDNTDWFQLGGGDGFLVVVDPLDEDQIYYESQYGAMGRLNLRTGEGASISPRAQQGQRFRFNWKTPFLLSPHNSTILYSAGNYVFRSVFKGNNMRAISPEITTDEVGTGSALAESPVEEGVLYAGTTDGNVWVTTNGGVEWVNVFTEPERLTVPQRGGRRGRGARGGRGRGGAARGGRGRSGGADAGQGETAGGAETPTEGETTADAQTGDQQQQPEQSQIDEEQVSRLAAAVQEEAAAVRPLRDHLPGPRWVSSLSASKFAAGRCYITLDAHRSNDDEPYVLVTEDYGRSWRSIRANLPTSAGSTRVIREDIVSENVLYLGCEFSAWVSIDRGQSWTKFNNNLPTVAVHDFAIHPTMGEIVAATHGRSLWIADVSHIRQMSAETLAADAHLYRPNTVIRWRREPRRGSAGTRVFAADGAPNGAQIYYSLGKDAQSVELTVSNVLGDTLYQATGETAVGLHSVTWNLGRPAGGRGRGGAFGQGAGGRGRRGGAGDPGAAAGGRGGRGGLAGGGRGGRGGGGRGRGGRGGPAIAPGSYLVTLTVDGAQLKQPLSVEADPDFGAPVLTPEGYEFLDLLNAEGDAEERGEEGGYLDDETEID